MVQQVNKRWKHEKGERESSGPNEIGAVVQRERKGGKCSLHVTYTVCTACTRSIEGRW